MYIGTCAFCPPLSACWRERGNRARMIPVGQRALALKAFSFGLIGVLNSAVDFGVFSLAYYYFHTGILTAQIAAWIIAVTGSYVMNSMITFAAESGQRLG